MNYEHNEVLVHFHPVYENLHCGSKTGIYHTNEKDITCGACRSNIRSPLMEISHYMREYEKFNSDHFPSSTIEDVELKMLEEMGELAAELSCDGTLEDKIAELTDVMNMSLKLLNRYGVADPLHAGWQKLQLTAEKYRAAKLRPE